MRTLIWLAAIALAAPVPLLAAEIVRPLQGPLPLETSCVRCHAELEGEALEPTKRTADDIHFRKGLSCHSCHGGNPAAGLDGDFLAAHDESKGFKGKPGRTQIPQFCADCHSDAAYMKRYNPSVRVDQMAEYLTSVHGMLNRKGDENAAVCVDCHGAHGVLPAEDPRSLVHAKQVADMCARCHADDAKMAPYKLSTTQVAEYKKSVHAKALYEKGDTSAPTCNDCHGSHGAVPPGVDSVANVCGSCHGREATLFREREAIIKVDLSPCIQCVICHDNHAVRPPKVEMLGVGPESTCTACHAPGERIYGEIEEWGQAAVALTEKLHEAHELLERAEKAGMEVGPDKFALQAAVDHRIETRVLAHSFDTERFLSTAREGIAIAEKGIEAGHRAFAELRTRRIGLAASLLIIVAVIVALALKVKEIETKPPKRT